MLYKFSSKHTEKDLEGIIKIAYSCNLNIPGIDGAKWLAGSSHRGCISVKLPSVSRTPQGFVLFSLIPPEGEIYDIAVMPYLQGCGIGSALLKKVSLHFITNNVHRIYLEVRRSNMASIRFYEKHGFKSIDVRYNYYGKNKEDALIMLRDLG